MAKQFDIVIAGGGIAGMTAGVTAARLGRSTLILTGDVPGGQLISIEKVEGLAGFPDGVPGYDLCPMMQDQAAAAGVEFMMNGMEHLAPEGSLWRATTAEGGILARGVILATGSTLKKLGVPGEDRLAGCGVSHCATCNAPLLRNKIVAVIGGGDLAMQEALTLAEFAAKVIIFNRSDALTGQASYRGRVTAHPTIEIVCNKVVTEILGDTTVSGLRVQDTGNSGTSEVETAAIFAYVGLDPNTTFLNNIVGLDLSGQIPTDAWMRTELAGVCAAGNIRCRSACRAASAAGDGANAAVAIDRYLTDGSWQDSKLDQVREIALAAAHG